MRRAIDDYLRSFERVEQLVVLKTDRGRRRRWPSRSIDPALPDVVGTIAGDDTILVICRPRRRRRVRGTVASGV